MQLNIKKTNNPIKNEQKTQAIYLFIFSLYYFLFVFYVSVIDLRFMVTIMFVCVCVCVSVCMGLGFPVGSDIKESACSAGDVGSTPGLGRSPGGGSGNSIQYSCLENLMDREA